MFSNARQILISELVLAEHASEEEVEKMIDNKINISFDEYKTPHNEEETLNNNVVNKFIPFNNGTTEA